jgi:2-oxo-4-hydroxy-4-carboxy-5-ureidoimidazoline decarboxylase
MDKLGELNGAEEKRALALLEPLIERAPEIASRVSRHRPFAGAEGLCAAIRTELQRLDEAGQIRLFRAHPELAPDNPLAMTLSSQAEQGRLNLTADTNKYRARLGELNARYTRKFGFPFITALVRHKDIDSVLAEFETRLASNRDQEIQTAIDQISHVSSSRVHMAFGPNIADASKDGEATEKSDWKHATRTENT